MELLGVDEIFDVPFIQFFPGTNSTYGKKNRKNCHRDDGFDSLRTGPAPLFIVVKDYARER